MISKDTHTQKMNCLQSLNSLKIYLQTMGMTMMLDEIINYVQSLQNQVEVS